MTGAALRAKPMDSDHMQGSCDQIWQNPERGHSDQPRTEWVATRPLNDTMSSKGDDEEPLARQGVSMRYPPPFVTLDTSLTSMKAGNCGLRVVGSLFLGPLL